MAAPEQKLLPERETYVLLWHDGAHRQALRIAMEGVHASPKRRSRQPQGLSALPGLPVRDLRLGTGARSGGAGAAEGAAERGMTGWRPTSASLKPDADRFQLRPVLSRSGRSRRTPAAKAARSCRRSVALAPGSRRSARRHPAPWPSSHPRAWRRISAPSGPPPSLRARNADVACTLRGRCMDATCTSRGQ